MKRTSVHGLRSATRLIATDERLAGALAYRNSPGSERDRGHGRPTRTGYEPEDARVDDKTKAQVEFLRSRRVVRNRAATALTERNA